MDNSFTDQDFFARMSNLIARRYRLNAEKSLRDVYQLHTGFLDTESDADFAIRNRAKILQLLAEQRMFELLVELFVNQTIEFTYASNQFIQIKGREEIELRRIYADYLHEIERLLMETRTDAEISARLNELVTEHFRDLRANISRFFDPEVGEDVQANVILHKVVCGEYSPEMQLEILGVEPGALMEPVLDLGCGKSGNLVRYLNQNGIQATGVDRFVEPSAGLIQADWLDYPLEPEHWGSIISHMAFSNHFLFHHLYQHGSVEPYARQYMAILKSLKLHGSYYYIPGSPFIEAYLPQEKFLVSRKRMIDDNHLYACRVERLGKS